MRKQIAIIEGGYSHEEIISRKSAKTIFEHIDTSKYNPISVSIDAKGWFAIIDEQKYTIDKNSFSYTKDNTPYTFDYAYIVIHGTPGEDGKLQAYFDMLHIPYSTSSQLASTLTFNKYVCNQFLSTFDINVAQSVLVRKNETYNKEQIIAKLGIPCFVKPTDGGSSFGVTKVTNIDQLDEAIKLSLQHGTEAILESFLSGIEVTNGIYRTNQGFFPLSVAEVETNNDFFDFNAKYKGESNEIIPARITDELTQQIKNTTLKVAKILDLKGICRIDYIIIGNTPYLIEVNTIPGMSKESFVPQMLEYENISLKKLLSEIIEISVQD